MTAHKPHPRPIDLHLGAQLRLLRRLKGLSQVQLGQALNVTFQQIQKYEKGRNRIAAGNLYRISKILDTPFSAFFQGFEDPKMMQILFRPYDQKINKYHKLASKIGAIHDPFDQVEAFELCFEVLDRFKASQQYLHYREADVE
ncbi:MAG: helix-turn-helix transcriptional regulator [Pseudomonadota bacterium]